MDAFATMITPFRNNGEVDLEAAIRYVDYYFENGLTGIFPFVNRERSSFPLRACKA